MRGVWTGLALGVCTGLFLGVCTALAALGGDSVNQGVVAVSRLTLGSCSTSPFSPPGPAWAGTSPSASAGAGRAALVMPVLTSLSTWRALVFLGTHLRAAAAGALS